MENTSVKFVKKNFRKDSNFNLRMNLLGVYVLLEILLRKIRKKLKKKMLIVF